MYFFLDFLKNKNIFNSKFIYKRISIHFHLKITNELYFSNSLLYLLSSNGSLSCMVVTWIVKKILSFLVWFRKWQVNQLDRKLCKLMKLLELATFENFSHPLWTFWSTFYSIFLFHLFNKIFIFLIFSIRFSHFHHFFN